MPPLISDILTLLESSRLPKLDLGDGFIYPYYSGYSLYNLPASVCYWLGASLDNIQPLGKGLLETPTGSYRHVILVLVDGMGLDWFLNYLQPDKKSGDGVSVWNDILQQATFAPLTSVVPSTTSTALTTLWTGHSPLEHGILGYEIWLKEFGIICNMITQTPASFSGDFGGLSRAGFQAATFLPAPTLGHSLAVQGIQSYAFMPQAISRSGLSTMHLTDTMVMPYKTLSDLWVSLNILVNSQTTRPSYTYVYYPDLDTLSHLFGPHDERVAMEFASFSFMFEQFIRKLRKQGNGDTLLLVTADHGFISTPPNPDYELANHPLLMQHLVMVPTGENRLPYLYIRPGQEEKVRTYIEQTWDGLFHTLPVVDILNAGLFGPLNMPSNYQDRLGDMIVIPGNGAYWWWANKHNPLLGRHGGLSRQEMLVPLIKLII